MPLLAADRAVQDCVREAIKKHDLYVKEDDHGYDFLVTPVEVSDDDPEEVSSQFKVSNYKVEVKTTTTGEPRLTPLQALTCANEPGTFVLCVVDLRNFPGDVHEVEWTANNVSTLCKLLPGGDIPIGETLSFVQDAEGSDVPIRNVAALRYAVRPDIWKAGLDFDHWVKTAFVADEST